MGKKNKNNAASAECESKLGWRRKFTKEEKALQLFIGQDKIQFPCNLEEVMLAFLSKKGMALDLLRIGKQALKTNAIHAGVLYTYKGATLPERYLTTLHSYNISSHLADGTLDGYATAFGLNSTAEAFGNKEKAEDPPCPCFYFPYRLFAWFGLSEPTSIVPIWAEAATIYVLTNGNQKAAVHYIAVAALDNARREKLALRQLIKARIMAAVELSIIKNCGD
jgi:hypothetical protein